MDKLDRLIADKKKEVESLARAVVEAQRTHAIAMAQLEAFEEAARARPISGASETLPRRGRQPGAISKEWREVLAGLYILGGLHSYQDIATQAERVGIFAELSSVRDRVRSFEEHGFMDGNAFVGFRVTAKAAERFGFGGSSAPDQSGATEEVISDFE